MSDASALIPESIERAVPTTSQTAVTNIEALVDPEVSRAKFERELDAFRRIAADRRKLGWWLLAAEFPEVLVAFVAPHLRPPGVVFGALVNFTNYDLWPPSVKLVNPFTCTPYLAKELPAELTCMRRIPGPSPVDVPGFGLMQTFTDQPLLVTHGPDEAPFFCIPGVREYHAHPAHTGDDWLLHRGRGEGTLFFILEKLYRYGVEPLKGYRYNLQVAGYMRSDPPE